MQKLIYLLIISIFFFEYVESYGLIPRPLTWVPELISMFVLVAVLFRAALIKNLAIRPFYIALFVIFVAGIVAGAVINSVDTGTLFTGLRSYFKFIPFFLLPAVFQFSDDQIQRQLLLLLAIGFVQLPVAVYQRFVESAGLLTGDYVRGTLETSSALTVFLVLSIAVVLALYLRRQLSAKRAGLMVLLLFVPATLNETKGTLILLPVALLVPLLFLRAEQGRRGSKLWVAGLGALLLITFVPIYNHFMEPRYGYGIVQFFTMEGRLQSYLAPYSSGRTKHVGRIDAIVLPVVTAAEDPVRLVVGFGAGNVSDSFLGKRFAGEFYDEYGRMVVGAMSNLLWETGLLGASLALLFCFGVFQDARRLTQQDGFLGAFALGWVAVVSVFVLALFYKNVIHVNAIGYMFYLYSGYVAAKRVRFGFPAARQRAPKRPVGAIKPSRWSANV